MKIGDLRHRIAIEQKQVAQDPDSGELVQDWVTLAERWASIQPLRGRTYWAAAMVQSEATHIVRMRYMAGVSADMRIRFGDRTFRIAEPPRNIDERNRELEFLVVEER